MPSAGRGGSRPFLSGGESNAKGQEREEQKGSGKMMGEDRGALCRWGSGDDFHALVNQKVENAEFWN